MTPNTLLPVPVPVAESLPVVGYAIRESDQFVWAKSEPPFAKKWRAVVYADDAQSTITALREEVERLTREWDASRAAALEEAALVCENMRDLKEAKDANDRAIAALERGDDRDSLSRLRHQSNVSLFNGALERAVKGIRALAANPDTSIQPPTIDASSGRVDPLVAKG